MTQARNELQARVDPEGSIFLPQTSFPEREFENWHLQLLLGRGIAEGKDYEEIQKLSGELEQARQRVLGETAIFAV